MKVMVATDGSDAAIEAAQQALGLLREGAEIVLVSVIPDKEDPMDDAGGFEGPVMSDEEADAEFVEHVHEGEDALARTARALGDEVVVRLAPAETEPGHAIVSVAEEIGPDLVVIGSSGKSLLRRLFTGSVSDYVVHHAPCPVLVIRHEHTH